MATIFYRVRERLSCDYDPSTGEFYEVIEHRVSIMNSLLPEEVKRFMIMSGIVKQFIPHTGSFTFFDIGEKDKLEEFISMLGHTLEPWS